MYSDGLLKLPIFTIQKNHKILLTVYSLSRIFCEKHGGNLKIYNARQGGAHVEALFKAE